MVWYVGEQGSPIIGGLEVLFGSHVLLYLGGGFKDVLFSPLPREMIQFD